MADPQLMSDIEEILDSGNTSPFFKNFQGGPWVQALEKEFATYVGARYAVSMANGTLALNAAYTAVASQIDWPYIKVPVTPYTFIATVSELVRVGLYPEFYDVTAGNFSLDPKEVGKDNDSHTGLLVIMHPLGSMADTEALVKIADDQEWLIVEDSCQALRRGIGCVGDAACFSGQQTKSLGFGGEGGMVVTNTEEVYNRLCYIRNHGETYGQFRDKYYFMLGSNYRLTEIQAAIALHNIRNYDEVIKHQLLLAEIIREAMHDSAWLIPQQPWTQNGYICAGRAHKTKREDFFENVKQWNKGIPGKVIGGGYTNLAYELPAILQVPKYFLDAEYHKSCPTAEMWRDNAVWLDVRGYSVDTVKDIAREIETFKP